jgi:hypothetical protein
MQGWYTVEMATTLAGPWTAVGSTAASEHAWSLTVTNNAGTTNVFFRLNQANGYVGSGGCAGCHGDKFAKYMTTAHATAHSAIASIGMGNNPNCTPCHTVGKGQPTGFIDTTNTPSLINVGCENCHGPAGWHKYSDHDLIRPAVSIDPKICGSCHQDDHHPTYEEYETTLHAEVNEDIKYGLALAGTYFPDTIKIGGTNIYGYFVSTNATGGLVTNRTTGIINSLNGPQDPGKGLYLYDPGQDRAAQCGVCHSAATRYAMLKDYEARLEGRTNALVMADPHDGGEWTATCVTCHDPHSLENPGQLRFPTRSTNYYTMPTTTDKRTTYTTNFQGRITTNVTFWGTTFSSLYDPNIQVCGQCHNTRGARWDGKSYAVVTNGGSPVVALTPNVSISRPPHHSVQYNVLIGIIQPDYLNTNAAGVATNFTSRHSGFTGNPYNTNQCVTCHMPSYTDSATGKAITGHTFELNEKGCALGGCHTSGVPDVEGQQINTTNNLSRLVDLLNQWATNKGPALLGTTDYNKSKENTWEFNPIGALAGGTLPGPVGTNQVKLPADILQARFNAYMVLHDGSLGVHNPKYTAFLLKDAETKVLRQLGGAGFTANTVNPLVGATVTFTNLTAGATECLWTFGDGTTSTSTAATVTKVYSAAGVFNVTLTTVVGGVTNTLTRNNFIIVYDKPVPSFTTGISGLTVNFTNTSTHAMYYRWTFMNGVSGSPWSNEENPTFTYTNAGTYQVVLRAYNEGGNVTITNAVTVAP